MDVFYKNWNIQFCVLYIPKAGNKSISLKIWHSNNNWIWVSEEVNSDKTYNIRFFQIQFIFVLYERIRQIKFVFPLKVVCESSKFLHIETGWDSSPRPERTYYWFRFQWFHFVYAQYLKSQLKLNKNKNKPKCYS